MPWNPATAALLEAPVIRPIWRLQSVQIGTAPGQVWTLVSPGLQAVAPTIESVSIAGQRIQLPDWSSTIGGARVSVIGDLRSVIPRIARGQACILQVGISGESSSAVSYLDLGIFTIAQVTRSSLAEAYEIELRDATALLGSRITKVATQTGLFSGLVSTTSASNYTVGDSTLQVTSTTGFRRETGGSYMLRISPANGDEPFYLTATGTATGPVRFTGVSSTGQLGSTAVHTVSGATVEEIAYISDHPAAVAAKILCSTGTGTNGPYDTLPALWGYGIPSYLVDIPDLRLTITRTNPAGSPDTWQVWADQEEGDGLGWLMGVLSVGGFWITLRQGRYTVRHAWNGQRPSTTYMQSTAVVPAAAVIDESQLAADGPHGWSAWSDDLNEEPGTVSVLHGSGSSGVSEAVTSLPAIDRIQYDASRWIHSNGTNWAASIADRVRNWILRCPEVLTITTIGLGHAALCPGDRVDLTTSMLHGRTAAMVPGYNQVRAMVCAVTPDYTGHKVTLELWIHPLVADEQA